VDLVHRTIGLRGPRSASGGQSAARQNLAQADIQEHGIHDSTSVVVGNVTIAGRLTPSNIVMPSIYSAEESARRISALCMPYTSDSLSFRWLVGNATRKGVRLTWRVRGSKPSATRFIGTFNCVDGKVVLSGKFSESPFEQLFVLVWFGTLSCILALCLYAALVHGNRDALGGAAFAMCLIAVVVWMSKKTGPGYSSDMAWVTSVLREALST